jgi:hypothetical protein
MSKIKLPRFPPRKARKTPTLINFVVRWFDKFQVLSLPIPTNSPFTLKSRLKLLLLSAIDRTSISRKARDLREQQLAIPSGEATLAWLKTDSVEQITVSQQLGFQHFLESLPENFQRVRKQGMLLAIDFHTDPNYAKKLSPYICKSKRKASTHQFYQYLSVIWLNAPEPITLGVQLLPTEHSRFERVRSLLQPLLTRERILGVLADGGFYSFELINWFSQKQVFFVIRGRINVGVKKLVKKYQEELSEKNDCIVIDYGINRSHTRKRIPTKLVLYQESNRVIALVVPPTCNLSGKAISRLYQRRFTIETYYRQIHRFQIFSCSQHPAVRFCIVLLAIWLCNFWAYFKAPLADLKATSRRNRADFIYTANDFCEFLRSSWQWTIFRRQVVFSRR